MNTKIKSYSSQIQAFGDKAILEDNGIRARLSSDDAGGMRPDVGMATGGVWLLVNADDAEEARELLEESE